MTDEHRFYDRFVEDVRRCAGGRAPASVAEIERRVRAAMTAPPAQRERHWAHVVAAINELLTAFARAGDAQAAERLRAFVRENADLGRPRDVAMTDFRFRRDIESVLVDSRARTYLIFAPLARAPLRPVRTLDEIVPSATRRFAEWAVYGLCGGAALAALWFAFVAPV